MVQIKRRTLFLGCILICALGLCACGKKEQKENNSSKEETLLQNVNATENVADSYKTATAIKGDFFVEVELNGKYYVPDKKAVRVAYDYGKMIFDEYLVKNRAYVNEGDVIANVRIEVSEADILEAKLHLQRMEERLAYDKEEYAKDDHKAMQEAYGVQDPVAKGVAITAYEEMKALHDQSIASRERSIADEKEVIAKMEAAKNMTTIVAPCSGYISELATYSAGNEIKNKSIMGLISEQESNMIVISDFAQGVLAYGQDVEVVMTTKKGEETLTGTVISPSINGGEIAGSKTVIRLPKTVEELPKKDDVKKIKVNVKYCYQPDAIMIKYGSLQEDKGNFTATVLTEDGSIVKKNVIVLNSNEEYHWVLKGLEEGDVVVIP